MPSFLVFSCIRLHRVMYLAWLLVTDIMKLGGYCMCKL